GVREVCSMRASVGSWPSRRYLRAVLSSRPARVAAWLLVSPWWSRRRRRRICGSVTIRNLLAGRASGRLPSAAEREISSSLKGRTTPAGAGNLIVVGRDIQLSFIKAATGLPPHQYVITRRVERAKHLLREGTDSSLAEVAAQAGFYDQSQFSHHFKRLVGVTPSQFRMSSRIA